MAEKVQFGSKVPLGKTIPFYDMFATSCIFPSSSFSLNWSLRNSTAMKVRAEAGMYHVILGTLPLNNPLTPSIIQILRIASSPPLYLRVHHIINKQYYCQNYICLSIWITWQVDHARQLAKLHPDQELKKEVPIFFPFPSDFLLLLLLLISQG